ncbi:MAG: tRNA (N(6)-L-threonylcarbamoyladenosine(37)-C(2))-methylthiotransferase MtaB [Proteobacteria bacterium]|nr:tRNA (N(6)-L-threonylcarbamoyladenosine(37)-C(2))-methylthiotransferase MtaB [Pseudomonadota bacterium]
MSEVQVVSFGCRLNAYEAEVITAKARAAGINNTIIVNTCAVTMEAERKNRQAIRRLARENPGAKLFVTGCASHLKPESYAALPGVSGVIANDAKLKIESYAPLAKREEDENFFAKDFEKKPRVYLQVQNGCDHRCTFCIIPFGRGASRSIPVGVIAARLRGLVAQGVNEVVFTGVDITSYGKDLPGTPSLGQMARRVLALVPELPRLRFSSLDPAVMDEDLWRLFAKEPRVMPHLHLSVQAGDDMILKRMKRRHARKDILKIAARAQALRPDVALGADLIAGFPTEDEAMFRNTFDLVEEAGLTWLHVFPYSPRPGTPAARMPQLDPKIRNARALQLRRAGEKAVQNLLHSMVGKMEEVLVEKNDGGKCLGRTRNYAEVAFTSNIPAGELAMVQINRVEGACLAALDEKTGLQAA